MNIVRSKKAPNYEAQELIRRNSSLQNILKDTNVGSHKSSDNRGFMYLSRFNKDEDDVPKVKEKSLKDEKTEGEVNFVNESSKTLESTVSSTINHDKKRR